MPVDTANRIWWAADDLWRKETVLTLFEIVKPTPGTNGPSVELPKSGAVTEPAFRMAVGIMAHQNPKVSIAVSTQLRSHLGAGCIEQAVQPLLEREARTRVWDYVAGLGIAFAAAKVTILTDLITRSQYWWLPIGVLGRVDGFDQDEAESKRDERAVILRRLLASKRDTLEALELSDRLFDACPRFVECFRKEGGLVFDVGSIRDCWAYSALACGLAV